MGLFFKLIMLAVLLQTQSCASLSVTNYGAKKIGMMRHGEKYATNRDCYVWEDVQPKYHGMTHIRGLNDKTGWFTFDVDAPVFVYLAVDSRYSYIHGAAFENTHDNLMFGGCHSRIPFHIYRSKLPHAPGKVKVYFSHSRVTGVFVRDARLIQPAAELKIVPLSGSTHIELGMVRNGEKFSTNRDCYIMSNIPPRFYGLTHVRVYNDETKVSFQINVPAIVYVASDSRKSNILPSYFLNTGEKVALAGCHPELDFPVYAKKCNPGIVQIHLHEVRTLTVFVEPIVDNTFKSGVY